MSGGAESVAPAGSEGSTGGAASTAAGGRAAVHVAAFDVDGTLTVRDCVGPFLRRVGGRRGLLWAVLRRPVASLVGAARRDRDRLKEVVVGGVMRGRRVADVAALGAQFADEVFSSWLRPDTLARLRWHQGSGHRVVLVSASLGPYLHPLGSTLGVDGVLCAEPRRAADGEHFADGLEGANCRRAEKVRRLDAWLDAVGARPAFVWAYGDSSGDTELLARSDRPLWVKGVVVSAAPEEGAP